MPTRKTASDRKATPVAMSREEAFRLSEASVALEGIDPATNPTYLALKARVLADEITAQEATAIFLAQSKKSHSTAA